MKRYRMIPLMVRWGGTIAWMVAAVCAALGVYLSLHTGQGIYAVGGVLCALVAYALVLTASEIIDVISETLLPR
jgi:hypothetical protein